MSLDIDLLSLWTPIMDFVSTRSGAIMTSLVVVAIGFAVTILFRIFLRTWKKRLTRQALLILRKAVSYVVTVIVVITVLQQFGVNLTALLGAAGIAGIAIGFAAQTSLANIISGLFLIWEKSFQVGDVIRVSGHVGIVESIDMLSLTLRTFDNLSVRLPNESLVKGDLVNITRYPVRRYDIEVGVSYREDPDRVMAVLRETAQKNLHVLEEPEPLVAMTGFGESALNFFLGVWHEKDDYIVLRNSILRDIKLAFEQEGIEIPYPHRVVVAEKSRLPDALVVPHESE